MRTRRVAATLAALTVVLVPSLASAHTELVRTDPKDGSRLDVTPTTVTLYFNDAISPELSTVLLSVGDKGDERRSVLPVRQGRTPSTLTATVPPEALPEGRAGTVWLTTYRVTSRDGHAVEGSIAFRAPAADGSDEDPAAAPTTPGQSSPTLSPQPSSSPQSVPEAVDGPTATTSTTTSTLVIGGITLLGVATGCGWLIRARRRSFDS